MIQPILLGQTGLTVSRLGLGTVKFGRNEGVHYPEQFKLPTDNEIIALLELAKSLGMNLLDTAPAYGVSEERLGKLLKKTHHDWVISTKVGEEFINGKSFFDFSKTAIEKSITRSLKRLNKDVLDIVLVHSNGEDQKIIEKESVFTTLSRMKESGLIRAFGMSTKTIEGGQLAVAHSDVVMVTYNPLHTLEKSVINFAQENNKGIFIKKALASGHLQKISSHENPVLAAMRFIFKERGVSSIILGTINPAHLKENASYAYKVINC